MKKSLSSRVRLLFGVMTWLLLIVSCSKSSSNDRDGGDSDRIGITAKIGFEDGTIINYKGNTHKTLIVTKYEDHYSLELGSFMDLEEYSYVLGIHGPVSGTGEFHYDQARQHETVTLSVTEVDKKTNLQWWADPYPWEEGGGKLGTFVLNITSLADNRITGTFSGTLHKTRSGERIVITEGKIDGKYSSY